jgi:hypothetical protein
MPKGAFAQTIAIRVGNATAGIWALVVEIAQKLI